MEILMIDNNNNNAIKTDQGHWKPDGTPLPQKLSNTLKETGTLR